MNFRRIFFVMFSSRSYYSLISRKTPIPTEAGQVLEAGHGKVLLNLPRAEQLALAEQAQTPKTATKNPPKQGGFAAGA
jgi:hypothetical protein